MKWSTILNMFMCFVDVGNGSITYTCICPKVIFDILILGLENVPGRHTFRY